MVDLEDIDGVGPSYADDLRDEGYESVAAVAGADPDDLDLFTTIGGEELQANAAELVDVEDVEATVDEDDGPYNLDPGFSEDQEHHLMGALLTEERNARKRNNDQRLTQTREAIASVREGAPYSFSLDQLTIAYTALNQLESEYRGTRGLSRFVGEVREMTQYFQSKRQEHWPDSQQ